MNLNESVSMKNLEVKYTSPSKQEGLPVSLNVGNKYITYQLLVSAGGKLEEEQRETQGFYSAIYFVRKK